MKKEKVLQFGDPVLRKVASKVTVFHKKLHMLVDNMAYTLEVRGDGAALAAPQIGVLKRVVVINYMDEYIEMINPVITESSGLLIDDEGCLSFEGFSGKVPRAETVTVTYQDRYGVENCISRTGPMARCIQHETDHLDGILYVDRMDDAENVTDGEETFTACEISSMASKVQTD